MKFFVSIFKINKHVFFPTTLQTVHSVVASVLIIDVLTLHVLFTFIVLSKGMVPYTKSVIYLSLTISHSIRDDKRKRNLFDILFFGATIFFSQ